MSDYALLQKDSVITRDIVSGWPLNDRIVVRGKWPSGLYTLRYNNAWQQSIYQDFRVSSDTLCLVTLCVDTFQQTDSTILFKNRQPGDVISLHKWGYGCEPYDAGTLKIGWSGRTPVGSLWLENEHITVLAGKGRRLARRRFKAADLAALRRLENQILQLPELYGGSTMTFEYELRLNGEVVLQKVENGMNAAVFEAVRNRLFPKVEIRN